MNDSSDITQAQAKDKFKGGVRRLAGQLATGTSIATGLSLGAILVVGGLAPFITTGITVSVGQAWLANIGANVLAGWLGSWVGQKWLYLKNTYSEEKDLIEEITKDLEAYLSSNPVVKDDIENIISSMQILELAIESLQFNQQEALTLLQLIRNDSRRGDLIVGRLHQREMTKLDEIEALIRSGSSSNTSLALYQLPTPSIDFVGRENEIASLLQGLNTPRGRGAGAIICSIHGLGGVGKTELSIIVADQVKDLYPDAQLFINLYGSSSDPLSPILALQTIIRSFDPLVQLPDNIDVLANIYRSLLNGKRILIVADDALNGAQIRSLIPPKGSALLITSRQRFRMPSITTEINLESLPSQKSELLLINLCPNIDLNAARLAYLCGYLPLALRISGSLLATDPTRDIDNYLQALEEERTRLSFLKDPDDPTLDVEASLELSYNALDNETRIVFCQLSVFPADFDLKAAEAIVSIPIENNQLIPATQIPGKMEAFLGFLYRRSLVEWNSTTRRYTLHSLVRSFAMTRMANEPEWTSLNYAKYYARIAYQARDLYMQGGDSVLAGLSLIDLERINIDRGWEIVQKKAYLRNEISDRLLVAYADATNYVSDLRYDLRNYRIPQLILALPAANRLGDIKSESAFLGNIGACFGSLDEPKQAIPFYEQHLSLSRNIGDKIGEGHALGNLGGAYLLLGEYDKAIELLKEHLDLAREINDLRGQSGTLGNLGCVYLEQGKIDIALESHSKQLQITLDIGDKRGEGMAYLHLASFYRKTGDIEQSLSYYEKSLENARLIGDRRAEALTAWAYGLLILEQDQNNKEQALSLMEISANYYREINHRFADDQTSIINEIRKKKNPNGRSKR